MRFGVLGPLEVSGGDGPLPLGGPKQRTVLAHLVLGANQVVPADHLIDAVWGEDLPEAPKAALQVYVSRLRSALGSDTIEGRPPGYVLRADLEEVDSLRFEELLREARNTAVEPRGIALTLSEALELWRGPALADLADEPSLSGEIARLEELRLEAVEGRIAAELDLGYHGRVVPELETLTHAHPLRERLWGELMLALYREDRQAEALSAFGRARATLADELGIDPSRELQLLHERILRQDPDLELRGEPLRGYRLLEQVGDGAYGVVYRAIQPQIGREVAIKAVHPELANHPDFVRRFEREAQIVARLEHPHVVPLYDYWREPDAAYLVMRFLSGGSLEDLVAAGPLEPSRAGSILDQVAAALAAAHRQGVVHRDVKSSNVLLDEEGNAYLTDFGVALDAGAPEQSSGATTHDSPAYLSPEQLRLEPATPQSDVYALGIVLSQMLDGSRLSPAVDATIERATAKDTEARFPGALELAAAFRAALEGGLEDRAPIREIRNPYKGLRTFLEADAGDFFGREALTERLVHRLGDGLEGSRFLAVVGASGSGKSSVVRAGLVPALRAGALPGSDRWYVIDVLPGAHPLRELESAFLRVAIEPPPSLLEDLEHDELGLVRAAARVLPDPGAELLIVVDQLEEIFTLVEDESERAHVLASLRAAAVEPGSRVRIVTTLRADFFDQPLSVRGFGDLFAGRTEAITTMAPDELERAIVAPAGGTGLTVEPSLLAVVIADVVDQPGALPLLQYALTELAERREDGVLTLEGYRRIGGVSGALARRAEQLFGAMNEGAKVACRQLLLRLVAVGESNEDTRRRVPRSELLPLADPQAIEGVIEAFGRYRLLTFDRDPETREPTVEIAHEALLGAWARLRDWIDEARDDIRTQRRLASAVAEWNAARRDPSFLLPGARLDRTRDWAETTTLALSDDDRDYLGESIALREDELASERAAQERERALERRSIRRLRSLVALGVAAALVATTLTVVAVNQRDRAEGEARASAARELAAAAVANVAVDTDRSILLAMEAVDRTRSVDGSVLREAEEALHRAVEASRIEHSIPGKGGSIDWSPKGVIATTGVVATEDPSQAGVVAIRDPDTGEIVRAIGAHDQSITDSLFSSPDVAFSPDGSMLATAGRDGKLNVWDPATGGLLTSVSGRDSTWAPSFSADGSLIAFVRGRWEGPRSTVEILDLPTERVRTFRAPPWSNDIALSPDGSRVVVVGGYPPGGRVSVIDIETGEAAARFLGPGEHAFTSVSWSPDGRYVAAGGWDSTVPVWEVATWKLRYLLPGHTDSAYWVDWAPDSSRLVTGGVDSITRVWEITSLGYREVQRLPAQQGEISGVAFSADGSRVMTSSDASVATIWDVGPAGGAEWGNLTGATGDVIFAPTGHSVTATGLDGTVTHLDLDTGRARTNARLDSERGQGITGHELSPDGTSVASLEAGARALTHGPMSVLDTTTGGELFRVADHVREVDWSPDGEHLAVVTRDSSVSILDRSGNEVDSLQTEPGFTTLRVRFSQDGRWIATDGYAGEDVDANHRLLIWDRERGVVVTTIRGGAIEEMAFDHSGTRIATATREPAIWDVESGELIAKLPALPADIYSLAFSPDGSRLAIGSADEKVRLFDADSGREVLVLTGHEATVEGVVFSPDGSMLASQDSAGVVRVWALDIDDLLEIARSEVTRSLTDEECRQFLHVERCPADSSVP